mgnify:CR=1 FL=1
MIIYVFGPAKDTGWKEEVRPGASLAQGLMGPMEQRRNKDKGCLWKKKGRTCTPAQSRRGREVAMTKYQGISCLSEKYFDQGGSTITLNPNFNPLTDVFGCFKARICRNKKQTLFLCSFSCGFKGVFTFFSLCLVFSFQILIIFKGDFEDKILLSKCFFFLKITYGRFFRRASRA